MVCLSAKILPIPQVRDDIPRVHRTLGMPPARAGPSVGGRMYAARAGHPSDAK
jgi:hypothetical protein